MALTRITTDLIEDLTIATGDIAALAVTTAKIADGNVTTVKIADANVTPAKLSQPLTQGTVVATTSGTLKDISIPTWAKQITLTLDGVSLSGTANLRLQLGTGGAPETSGYNGNTSYISGFGPSVGVAATTSGFDGTATGAAAYLYYGAITITNVTGNVWVINGIVVNNVTTAFSLFFSGQKSLAGALNLLRLTTTNGTDTFDAGQINVIYQ